MVCAECQALSRLSCCELNFEPFTVKYFKQGRDVRAHPGLKSLQGHVLTTCCTLELQGLPGRPAGDRPQAVVVVTDEGKRVIVPVTYKSNLIKSATEAQRWAASLPIWKLTVMRAQGFEFDDGCISETKKKKKKGKGNNWRQDDDAFDEDIQEEFFERLTSDSDDKEEEEKDEQDDDESHDDRDEDEEDDDDDCLIVDTKKVEQSRKRKQPQQEQQKGKKQAKKRKDLKALQKIQKELEAAKNALAQQKAQQAVKKAKRNTKACGACACVTENGFIFVEDMCAARVYLDPRYYPAGSSSSSSSSSSSGEFYKCCMFRTAAGTTGFTATTDEARKTSRVFVPRCEPRLDTDERHFNFAKASSVFPPGWALALVRPGLRIFEAGDDAELKALAHGPDSITAMRNVGYRALNRAFVLQTLKDLTTRGSRLAEDPSSNLLRAIKANPAVMSLRDTDMHKILARDLRRVEHDCPVGCFTSVKEEIIAEALGMGLSHCWQVKFVAECVERLDKDAERARKIGWAEAGEARKKTIEALFAGRDVAFPTCPRPHPQADWLRNLLQTRTQEELARARSQAKELDDKEARLRELRRTLELKTAALNAARFEKDAALRDKKTAKSEAAAAHNQAAGYKHALEEFKKEMARKFAQAEGNGDAVVQSSTVLWSPEFWTDVFGSYDHLVTNVLKPYVANIEDLTVALEPAIVGNHYVQYKFLTQDLMRFSVAWAVFSCLAMSEPALRAQMAQRAKSRNEAFDLETKLECVICGESPDTGKMLHFCQRDKCTGVLCLACALRVPKPHQCSVCRWSLYQCHNTTNSGARCTGTDLTFQGEKVLCYTPYDQDAGPQAACQCILMDARVLRDRQ
jgi:hypothetical protein